MEILLAIVLGTFFGFVLQRIGAADPHKIIGMLRLTDTHLMKTILAGIGISSSILFLGISTGLVDQGHLSVKTMNTGVLAGGVILGIGWAISGFCPGTGIIAAGTGRKDAMFFILGGLIGAGIFIAVYSYLTPTGIFNNILGGKIALAKTGKYDAALGNINGAVIAIIIGVSMILIAWKLPKSLR